MYLLGVKLPDWYLIGEFIFHTGESCCETCLGLPTFWLGYRELSSGNKIHKLFLSPFFQIQ